MRYSPSAALLVAATVLAASSGSAPAVPAQSGAAAAAPAGTVPSIVWTRISSCLANVMSDARTVAVDARGDIVAAGAVGRYAPAVTVGACPAGNGVQPQPAGGAADGWIAKFDGRTGTRKWFTYLGGTGWDSVEHIAVNPAGDVAFAGYTTSDDFPVRRPVARRDPHTGASSPVHDAVVGVLSGDGRTLRFSSYLSSPGNDHADVVRFTRDGGLIVVGGSQLAFGTAERTIRPTTGAYRAAVPQGFVTRFTRAGAVAWTSTMGPSRRTTEAERQAGHHDRFTVTGAAVDAADRIYLVGYTTSPLLPTTRGVVQPAKAHGGTEGYLARLSADGRRLEWATYLGGSGADELVSVGVDRAGSLVVYGQTTSTDLRLVNPAQPSCHTGGVDGSRDILAAKLTGDGTRLVYATCLGGSLNDGVDVAAGLADPVPDLAIDAAGNAYLYGDTDSPDFPTVNPWQTYAAAPQMYTDAVVVKLNPAGKIVWSSWLGGHANENARGALAITPSDTVAVAGATPSADFPGSSPPDNMPPPQSDGAFVTLIRQ